MTRLIDADAFKKENERLLHCDFPYLSETTLEELIDKAPTVDAEPVRHGKWIKTEEFHGYENEIRHKGLACSVCNVAFRVSDYELIEDFRYCPNCGARMDKE